MKKAEVYIDLSELAFKSKILQFDIIEGWIKQAQEDVIEETVQECAENATTELTPTCIRVDKNSILSIADKLIKEL